MVNVKFDGNKEAERMIEFLEENERVLGKSLVIFQCDGRTEESVYVRLKREMAERLGVIVSVVFISSVEELKSRLEEANNDEMIDGILVQLPVVESKKLKNSKLKKLKIMRRVSIGDWVRDCSLRRKKLRLREAIRKWPLSRL